MRPLAKNERVLLVLVIFYFVPKRVYNDLLPTTRTFVPESAKYEFVCTSTQFGTLRSAMRVVCCVYVSLRAMMDGLWWSLTHSLPRRPPGEGVRGVCALPCLALYYTLFRR